MKQVKNIWLVCLIAAFSLITTEKSFSQVTQPENKTEIKNSTLFHEDGYVKGITTARAIGLVELFLGVSSLVIALRSKKRSSAKGTRTALLLGLLAVIVSAIHFFITSGAVFGSGSGKAGSILAFILGTVGCILAYRTQKNAA